jgi:hypothetical protein
MIIANLMPTGCTVETHGGSAAIYDTEGNMVAIVCGGPKGNVELARLIVGLPDLLKALDVALEHGMLLPVARGISTLDAAVYPPMMRPAA